ncbi:hypothetical protein CJF30_00008721 [Rutstroemia sp. NJR-2017a BBW]|nr:hypothetical protein CJF30_00008721 [Rutstroemia sp. NJR-2017a BBW]
MGWRRIHWDSIMQERGLASLHHHIHQLHRARQLDLRVLSLPAMNSDVGSSGSKDSSAAPLPLQQFDAQVDEEKKRIWNTNPRTNWMSKIPIAGTEEKQAINTIKGHWVEQGIWKDKWDEIAAG